MRIRDERGEQVQTAQETGARQDTGHAVEHYLSPQPFRQVRPVERADRAQEIDVVGAAPEEDVLAVVDLDTVLAVAEGVGAAPEEGAFLDQRDFAAMLQQPAGSREPRQAPAQDGYLLLG